MNIKVVGSSCLQPFAFLAVFQLVICYICIKLNRHKMTEITKAWIILLIAGAFETCWTIGLKYSEGFSKLWPSLFTALTLAISMLLLGYSIKTLPLGTAYAVWTGIGAVGTVIMGMILFNESKELIRVFFIFLIVAGIIGLKFFGNNS
jgi:quaternary ammonium compound-resistance protein SugE